MSEYRGKRLFDLVLVVASAPVWMLVLAVVALRVRQQIGSPVFFRQRRAGLDGALFEMIKFRSMTDARDASGALLPDADRLLPFGRWLRSTSLDELPELWNVLKGEMTLVGPRPLLPQYGPRYSAEHRRRLATRPGLTGLAQVSGRNAIGWSAKFDLDVRYVDRCSLALDVEILWRTIAAIVRRDGISASGDATMPEFTGYDAPVAAPPPRSAQ